MDNFRLWGKDLRLSSDDFHSCEEVNRNAAHEEQQDEGQHDDFVEQNEEEINFDVTNEFSTDMVFNSRDSLIEWIKNTARHLGFMVVIKRSEKGLFGSKDKLLLQCECGGTYKSTTKSTKLTGTRKCNCPFQIKGIKLNTDDDWKLRVVCGRHNHNVATYMEGHSYAARLSDGETNMLIEMSKNLVKPRNILTTIKNGNSDNVSTIQTIYNARKKYQTVEKAGKSQIQHLLSNLNLHDYIFFYRSDQETNELQDLFFAHPQSLELLRAFPHVLIMDATYKTNRFRMPLFEIVGVTSTEMTFSVAFVFMHFEKEDNYTWALSCLQSTMDECTHPRVIVTDRDLALMKSCASIFPDSSKLLCKWHIGKNIIANCKKQFHDKESWDAFYSSWHALVDSETENEYVYNLSTIECNFSGYPVVIKYIADVWLKPYKEMFVAAWTDKYMHFGNRTTNRAESQNAKLKRYLGTSQMDFKAIWASIHQLLEHQFNAVKASLEKSKNIFQHRFNSLHFREVQGFVSSEALDMILKELDRSKVIGIDVYQCGCKLRITHGLPCAHELATYIQQSLPIPIKCIDAFWKKLDLLPCASLADDDISCSAELQMFEEQFNQKTRTSKGSLLRKLRELINPSTTVIIEPKVKAKSRGRPSNKKKIESSTRREPSAFEYVEKEISLSLKSSRHSCSSIYIKPSFEKERRPRSSNVSKHDFYISQFPQIMQPYIQSVIDVKANENCGFRSIAGLLGYGENAWANIRQELIYELRSFWTEYVDLLGGYERAWSIDNSLNFFDPYNAAPIENWMTMPDMGCLIASRYNIILHFLSSPQCLTFMPLRSIPPPQSEHDALSIGFVNGNHFVQLALSRGYPMPPIYMQWFRYRYECASGWVAPYNEQLALYIQGSRSTQSSDYIEL